MLSIQGIDVLNYINAQKENGKEVNLGTNEGVYIANVDEDGNGAEAGLKEGDVITKVDGKKVTKMAELQEILEWQAPWQQDEHHLPAQQEGKHQDHHTEECPG